jgi:hypothetical protein
MKFLLKHSISIILGAALSYGLIGILGAQDLDDSGTGRYGLLILAGLFACAFFAAATDTPLNRRLNLPVFIGMSCITKALMIGFAIAAIARLVLRYSNGLSLSDKAAYLLIITASAIALAELLSFLLWRFFDRRKMVRP